MTRRDLLKAGVVTGVGASLAGGALLGAGCGDDGGEATGTESPAAGSLKAGGIMTLATDQLLPKDSLNTLTNITDGVDAVQGMIREGLVTYDFGFAPQPRLAERWEINEEVTEYTFYMRPNVVWHDGSAFTARDAYYSLERILDPDEGSGMYDRLATSIEKVTVVDDMTLKLELKRPDALILMPLANQQCYLVKENDPDLEAGIGTGPFKLKSWNPGQSYEVEKFDGYWMEGAPILDGVRGIAIPEASTMLQSVATGDADVCQVPFDQLSVVQSNADLQITPYEKAIMYCAVALVTADPWKDPRVREALKRSLDRDKLMEVAYAGQSSMSPDSCIAMGDPDMSPELEARTVRDLAAAEELMAAAGYPDGIDIELKYPGDPTHANFGLGVAAGLKGSPFRVTPKAVPADTYWDTVWMSDPFCVSDWNRRHPIETMALQVQSEAPWNESGWKSPKMDELIETAFAASADELSAVTTEACLWQSGSADDGSGELIPAYMNRLWTARLDTKVVVSPFSMLDFRQCGFVA